MAFKLLKRGNRGKMEAQEVVVPASTSLAVQANRHEEASREENSIIKARVRARARADQKKMTLSVVSCFQFLKLLHLGVCSRSCLLASLRAFRSVPVKGAIIETIPMTTCLADPS